MEILADVPRERRFNYSIFRNFVQGFLHPITPTLSSRPYLSRASQLHVTRLPAKTQTAAILSELASPRFASGSSERLRTS